MNKFGENLKKLRTSNNETLVKLSEIFSQNYFMVSPTAISDWENGKSLPDMEKIDFLCDHYKKSIDDLFYGEELSKLDFEKQYFPNKNSDFEEESKYTQISWSEFAAAIARTKFLLDKYLKNKVSKSEEKEFTYLLLNFYDLSLYGGVANYFKFLDRLARNKTVSKENKRFNALKVLKYSNHFNYWYGILTSENSIDKGVDEVFKNLENFEKDLMLSDMWFYSPWILSKIENDNDKTQTISNIFKYMVENGARVVPAFIEGFAPITVQKNVIEEFEKVYFDLVKPIRCTFQGVEYEVPNTFRNRLVIRHRGLVSTLKNNLNLSIEKMVELTQKHASPTPEILKKVRDNFKKKMIEDEWIKFTTKELEIKAQLDWYFKQVKKLQENGYVIGPNTLIGYEKTLDIEDFKDERRRLILKTIAKMSYELYTSSRDEELTNSYKKLAENNPSELRRIILGE